jgi:Family of unknown function (DUF6226)
MASVVTEQELLDAVDKAFAVTGRGLAPWLDPHPDRRPRDEEYSRLSDPAKWRIIGARADAWEVALRAGGLAEVERNVPIRWEASPRTVVSRADRLVPHAAGGLPLVLARSHLGPVDDAGVTLGVGDPAVAITWIPDCGCDACDSGSQDVLDELDEAVVGVVSGAFRRLASGDRVITVIGTDRWSASSTGSVRFARGEVAEILAEPTGWREISGAPWWAGR